ncbi:hypothetical protein D4Q52_15140 [Rhodopseudomonas palustris]|uniref:Uncharacterized protein n=1 Tax=Rhodopseudomonas palustris TaxID=1076 RepID=A0A418V4C7_RHOPL|nr:hypothetical protein D4Q52_15140 [Rhodopseudomonas palustris]
MPGLVPGIHALLSAIQQKAWMAGTSPAMTEYVANGAIKKPLAAQLQYLSRCSAPIAWALC